MLTFFSFLLSLHLGGEVMRGVEGGGLQCPSSRGPATLGKEVSHDPSWKLREGPSPSRPQPPPLAMAKDSSTS